MSRTVSAAALAAMAAQETGEELLVLVTIEHDDLATPIRVCDQSPDVTSRTNLFQYFPIRVVLPWEREDQLPAPSLGIDAVDRQIITALRALDGGPTVTLELVLRSTPDTLEYGPYEMSLRNAQYDALTIEGVLGYSHVLDEKHPKDAYTPDKFPGLF